MAYVRNHGNQLAIVHGERDPSTRKVQQRVLFTLCSKPEALAAMGRGADGWQLSRMLEQRYPQVSFDWEKIRAGIAERMESLPDTYAYRAGEVLGRFRDDLCAFTRQIGLADPQSTHAAAELIRDHRVELEYVRDLIDWRLATCEQQPNEWNGDNAFFWRRRLQSLDVPPAVIEQMSELYAARDLDRLEALARLFVDSFEDYADGHNYLGLVAEQRGELDEAVVHFQRAVTEGRKLFPKRLAKKHYWGDIDTRPYMRGLRNLAGAYMLLARYDEALQVCERMERECGDTHAAASLRAYTCLNMGRWVDAWRSAEQVVDVWPEHAYVAAFAAAEQGDREAALRWFLHGVLTRPRSGMMLLGVRSTEPEGHDQVLDHNAGVEQRVYVEGYLARLSDDHHAFFVDVLEAPTTRQLLAEVREASQPRAWNSPELSREARERAMRMRSVAFAREAAERVRSEVRV